MAAVPGDIGQAIKFGAPMGSRSFPTRSVPRVELPASTSELAHEAATRLGWQGVVLPEVSILGRKVSMVARLRTDVHAERLALGMGPVSDRTLVTTWTWPELAHTAPAPAAEIVGVLAIARHWRTALGTVFPFSRYNEAALVLPASTVMTEDYVNNCLPRARSLGVAVVTADQDAVVETDLSAPLERMFLLGDTVSRWINEMVYEQLLASYDLPLAAD